MGKQSVAASENKSSASTVSSGPLQRQTRKSGDLASVPPIVHDVLRSSGKPLEPEVQAEMESRFNHDFGNVRIHTGSQAAQSAESVNATAYTVKNHIAFDAGQYAPGSQTGKRLLAHELAHVVQQSRAVDTSSPTGENNSLEIAADKAALTISHGNGEVNVDGASAPMLSRQARDQFSTLVAKLTQAKTQVEVDQLILKGLIDIQKRYSNNDNERKPEILELFRAVPVIFSERLLNRLEPPRDEFGRYLENSFPKTRSYALKVLKERFIKSTKQPKEQPRRVQRRNDKSKAAPKKMSPEQREAFRRSRFQVLPGLGSSTRRPSTGILFGPMTQLAPDAVGHLPSTADLPSYEDLKENIYKSMIEGAKSAIGKLFNELRRQSDKLPKPLRPAFKSIIDNFATFVDILLNVAFYFIGLGVGFAEGIFDMIWGFLQIIYGIGNWLWLLGEGLLKDPKAFKQYNREILAAVKSLPQNLIKIKNAWVKKFRQAPMERKSIMVGELFGQIIALLATLGAASTKIGQIPKLKVQFTRPVVVGDTIAFERAAVVTVDLASPTAAATIMASMGKGGGAFGSSSSVKGSGGSGKNQSQPDFSKLTEADIEQALEPIDPTINKHLNPRKRGSSSKKPRKAAIKSLPIEDIVLEAIKLLKESGVSGGLSPRQYGTKLHAAVSQVVKKHLGSIPKGWTVGIDKSLKKIIHVRSSEIGLTVQEYMKKWGMVERYPKFPEKFLETKIGEIKPDLYVREPSGRALIWDLTSREQPLHVAKTMFYTEVIGRETGGLFYMSETYWRKIFLK